MSANSIEEPDLQVQSIHNDASANNSTQSHIRNEKMSEINETWMLDSIDSNEISIDIPLPNPLNVQLTGLFDDTQALVISEKNLVIMKKVCFKDMLKFISGCSTCHNINSDFLLYLDASSMYDSSESSPLLKCEHIKSAVSYLLNKMNGWKRSLTENEIQIFLLENCNWQSETCFYVSSSCTRFCASLSSNDGIVLFELRNNRWKCAACKYQFANKCRHGQIMNFPEQTDDQNICSIEPESVNIRKTVQLLSNQRFSGKHWFKYGLFFVA